MGSPPVSVPTPFPRMTYAEAMARYDHAAGPEGDAAMKLGLNIRLGALLAAFGVTLPQVHGMYQGDRSRKETLVEYGFRLPSALDN